MKHLIVALSVFVAAGVTPVLATPGSEDPRSEAVFAKQFAGAENVKWASLSNGFEKAAFTLAGTRVEAYFGADGELLGTVRNLFYSQLPLAVIQGISSHYSNFIVTEAREINNTEGTSYSVVLEIKDRKYDLKMNPQGDIVEVKKTKKK